MPFRPWRAAWHQALYGTGGFFVTSRPSEHFRTSVTASPLFAEAVARTASDAGLRRIVDLGAGGGELLTHLHRIDPDLQLHGVELADRPAGLPSAVAWSADLPAAFDGLLIANEWLDNIPCEVVEVDPAGVVREVLVDPATGAERLGDRVDSAWLDTWWPLAEPGARAEIGQTRDAAWADAVARVHGVAIAIDYGHLADGRPPFGSLTSFAHGRELEVRADGSRDLTAHVAVDAVAATAGARLERQRDALQRLGISGSRPPLALATDDPAEYVRLLSRASEAAELRAPAGLGDFWWIVTDTRVRD